MTPISPDSSSRPTYYPPTLSAPRYTHPRTSEFSVHQGPIFANLVLADEVNRAPAKVQSALLEAMQERQVTIGDTSFKMEELFLVLATQNPIEQEGTYPLPEAQVDRFMLKVIVEYPDRDEEKAIIDRMTGDGPLEIAPVVSPEDILNARKIVRNIYVDDQVKDYILDLVMATRYPQDNGLSSLSSFISYGASPRASIYMVTAARANAFIQGRGYVSPEDVKAIAQDVLRHRIIPTYEAEAEAISSSQIVATILEHIEVP